MKNLGLLFLLTLIGSCSVYKIAPYNIYYSPEVIQKYIIECKPTDNELQNIPPKLIKTLKNNGYWLTNDSLVFKAKVCNTLLKEYYHDKTEKRGYFSVVTSFSMNNLENQIILYEIKRKNLIVFSPYELPNQVFRDSMKYYLIPNNGVFRFGGKTKKRK